MMNEIVTSSLLSKTLPDFNDADLIFAEPWEARAFAIIVNLAQAGYFTWGRVGRVFFHRRLPGLPPPRLPVALPRHFYEQWLDAAEILLVAKGVTSRPQLLAKRFAIGAAGAAHVMA